MKATVLLFLIQFALVHLFSVCSRAQGTFWAPTSGPQDEIIELIANSDGYIFARGVTVYRTTDLGESWTGLTGGASGGIGFVNDREVVSLFYTNMVKSTDNGDTWITIYSTSVDPLLALATDAADFIACWVACTDPYCIPRMLRSFNGGTSWEGISDDGYLPQVAKVHRTRGILIIRDGIVYRSHDFGTSWFAGSGISGSPRGLAIRSDGFFYVGSTDGIYVSVNALVWEQRSLDSISVNSIAFDEDGHLFVATSIGVLSSADSGYTWTAINSGLGDSVVTCLVASPDGYLYAGTETNGVYRSVNITTGLNDGRDVLPANLFLGQNYPNPFNPTTTFSFTTAQSSIINLTVYDLRGREVATIVNEKLGPGTYSRQWDAAGLASGVYVYRLQSQEFIQSRKLVLIR